VFAISCNNPEPLLIQNTSQITRGSGDTNFTNLVTLGDVTVGEDLSVTGDMDTTALNASSVITTASAYFGSYNDGNYSAFDITGTLTYAGEATTWDDMRVPVNATNVRGANDPGFIQVIDNGRC